eukprot:scaffold2452_cov194-Amphora_coffeaeformis.AAC.3
MTATGEVGRGVGKWAAAALRGRTNVADKGRSSGQEGKGLGRVVGVGPMAVLPSSTASMLAAG